MSFKFRSILLIPVSLTLKSLSSFSVIPSSIVTFFFKLLLKFSINIASFSLNESNEDLISIFHISSLFLL